MGRPTVRKAVWRATKAAERFAAMERDIMVKMLNFICKILAMTAKCSCDKNQLKRQGAKMWFKPPCCGSFSRTILCLWSCLRPDFDRRTPSSAFLFYTKVLI